MGLGLKAMSRKTDKDLECKTVLIVALRVSRVCSGRKYVV